MTKQERLRKLRTEFEALNEKAEKELLNRKEAVKHNQLFHQIMKIREWAQTKIK